MVEVTMNGGHEVTRDILGALARERFKDGKMPFNPSSGGGRPEIRS